MIALRLTKRRDGTYVVTDAHGSPTSPDREFPAVHWFQYDRLVDMGAAARVDGDQLRLELANATATYRVVRDEAEALELLDRDPESHLPPTGICVVLVDQQLTDPTPIDEEAASTLRAARFPDGDPDAPGDATVAHAGAAVVDEEA